MWGRCVRGNIQKFLQFQISVNAVALVIAFIAGVSKQGEPLTPIQLLWVNLIQDTMAALALATEKPTDDLLMHKPAGRRERLITPLMWRNILVIAIYELIILFGIVYAGDKLFNITDDEGLNLQQNSTVRFTMVFNTFVFMAIFNEINCRRLDNRWNIFEGFFTNWIFVLIVVGTGFVQALLVSVGGIAFHVVRLNWKYWLICLALGLSIIPFGIINRVLIPIPDFEYIKYEQKKTNKKKKSDKDGSDSDEEEKIAEGKKEEGHIAEMELP